MTEVKAKSKVQKPEPKLEKIKIRSKVGVMVHPFAPYRFEGESVVEVYEIDSWLQAQIDAKKLELC